MHAGIVNKSANEQYTPSTKKVNYRKVNDRYPERDGDFLLSLPWGIIQVALGRPDKSHDWWPLDTKN